MHPENAVVIAFALVFYSGAVAARYLRIMSPAIRAVPNTMHNGTMKCHAAVKLRCFAKLRTDRSWMKSG